MTDDMKLVEGKKYIELEPVMDGWLEIQLIKAPEDMHGVIKHMLEEIQSWNDSSIQGIQIQYARKVGVDRGRIEVYPWSNLAYYKTINNSDEWNVKHLEWIRNCDHQWLSHPTLGNYCWVCRLDMQDLEKVIDPAATSAPPLFPRDARMDVFCRQFEAKEPDRTVRQTTDEEPTAEKTEPGNKRDGIPTQFIDASDAIDQLDEATDDEGTTDF